MRFSRLGRWVDAETGELLLGDLHGAEGFWQRLVGLQFAQSIPSGTGVFLKDCRSVHTFGMRFPIDIAFLDQSYRVVELHEAVRPWRVIIPRAPSVRHVVEANPGVGRTLHVGAVTRIE